MSLLEITGLRHAFGDNVLFQNADFALNRGEHVGVVGPNGAGKSTLIRICTGELVPDAGRVVWQPQVRVGYLDQQAAAEPSVTMRDFLCSAFAELYAAEDEMLRLYAQSAQDAACLEKAAALQTMLEQRDFYGIDTKIEQVASGLGLTALGLARPIGAMSGGQRAKVILAKLLLEEPDVLLLDEPTNFLDKAHVAWLGDYLCGLRGAFLVVSHDRAFLQKIAGAVCDVEHGRIAKYYGTYAEFVKKKELLHADYVRRYAAQQKKIEETEAFIRKNRAGIKSKMARGRQKQLDRMERLEAPEQAAARPSFRFQALPAPSSEQLAVHRLSVGYHYPVLSEISFSVRGGEKIVVTGFNGIGKSTLLKTLVGAQPALAGSFAFSPQAVIGYYAQDLVWADPARTPAALVSDAFPALSAKAVRRSLAQCGISAKHALQPVGTLSGGEQAKVKLCMLALRPCSFLILDEPTNHLDAQAKEALQTALAAFPGTVLLVSHEAAFYRDWAQRVLDIGKTARGLR